jgi:hypothetical protein
LKAENKLEFLSRVISLSISREEFKKAESYLLNYNFIRKKTILIGISELIEDYKLILYQINSHLIDIFCIFTLWHY